MKRCAAFLQLSLACLLLGGGCFDPQLAGEIALVQAGGAVADTDLLKAAARAFYADHPDTYDMLVMWGSPQLSPGHSFYLPVKNDVPGIGYGHSGPELFDNCSAFGSSRLQGIIWMGPDWRGAETGHGPRSALGILAQETGHRWGATLHFRDPDNGSDSPALLDDSCHWSSYLNTGASPLGGNDWQWLGGSLYQAIPATAVRFCGLDLYAMGLQPAEETPAAQLLVNIRLPAAAGLAASSSSFSEPFTVEADVREVPVVDIIAAEGRRDPEVGFNAKKIRQAWIYVYLQPGSAAPADLRGLRRLQGQWAAFFSAATGGLSNMITDLQ